MVGHTLLPLALAGTGSLNFIDDLIRSLEAMEQPGQIALAGMLLFVFYMAATAHRA